MWMFFKVRSRSPKSCNLLYHCCANKNETVCLYECVCLLLTQTRLDRSSAASWSTAWPASAAPSPSPSPTWCNDSTSPSTTPMTLSRGRSPTFPPISTSWVSCWTSRGHWGFTVPATTVPPARSSSSSPHRPITTSSSWTRWSRHEDRFDSLFSCRFLWCLSGFFRACQMPNLTSWRKQ